MCLSTVKGEMFIMCVGTDGQQQQMSQEMLDGKKLLDDIIHLAELCVEVLQQNEEHHAEVSICCMEVCTDCSVLCRALIFIADY